MPRPDARPGASVTELGLRPEETYILSLRVADDGADSWELRCPDSATGDRVVYVTKTHSALQGVTVGDVVAMPMELDSSYLDPDQEVILYACLDNGTRGDSIYAFPSACIPPITVPLDTLENVEAFLAGGS